MPKFLVPRSTGTHRVAAIALYRALLTSCPTVPIAVEEREPLRNVVRNKFRRNKLVHSSRLLTLAFNSGYDTLDLFDRAAQGDTASTQHISDLLEHTPAHLKRPPPLPKLPRQPVGRPPSQCPPPEQRILDTRPYLFVPGERKVPILRVNNGIPFLMYRKPQPLSLGRILRYKNDKNQERMDWLAVLEHDVLPEALHEDFWDYLLQAGFGIGDCDTPRAQEGGAEGEGEHKNGWAKEPHALRLALQTEWTKQRTDRKKTARYMQGIVDREEVLAKKEKMERKSLKTMEKQLKKKRYTKPRDDL